MEDENDESWLYGNSDGKESEQPPGTQNDAESEKADESKEKDSKEPEEPIIEREDPNVNQVTLKFICFGLESGFNWIYLSIQTGTRSDQRGRSAFPVSQ